MDMWEVGMYAAIAPWGLLLMSSVGVDDATTTDGEFDDAATTGASDRIASPTDCLKGAAG